MLVVGFLIKKPSQREPNFAASFNGIGTSSLPAIAKVKSAETEQRYINPNYAFSFLTPMGFSVSSFADTDTSGKPITTVIVQANSGVEMSGDKKGLQILISSWDEAPEALTDSRIHHDIPNMKITNSTTHDIKNIGTVIEFESDNANFAGKSHEVWFVAHNDLYQISTYAENKSMIDNILSTWNFQGQ